MLNYVNDECNLVNYTFHLALEEYLKEGGDAEKMINNWRIWNKSPEVGLPKITKREVEIIKKLREFDQAKKGDMAFASMIQLLLECPHATVDIMCIMQEKCKYNINVKTLELRKEG